MRGEPDGSDLDGSTHRSRLPTAISLSPALEDWVSADHPVRFMGEFVDHLDLPALGFAMPSAAKGRLPYAPSLLLKIWLHGYFHRIRATFSSCSGCSGHHLLLQCIQEC
jgi:hypothetical protein